MTKKSVEMILWEPFIFIQSKYWSTGETAGDWKKGNNIKNKCGDFR